MFRRGKKKEEKKKEFLKYSVFNFIKCAITYNVDISYVIRSK